MKNKPSAMLMLLLLLMSFLTVAVHVSPVASSPISKADYESAVIKVADRLVALQSSTDYGWDWVVTGLTSHSPNPSAGNIYGVTALELLDVYKLTSNITYFNAATAVADHLVSLGSNRYHYQFDLEFLIEFAKISGDTSYKDFASDVWNWIKTNKPEFADGVTLYNWYYTTRYPGSHGGAVWGTGDWAIVALELGDTAWATDMANVIADNYTKILTEPDPYEFQYVGWGKALLAFQALNPTAYADEIADIVNILASDPTFGQKADGSFSGWVQDEAYVTMGLVSVGETEMANKSAVWLIDNQGYDTIVGGWKLPDENEYSEVTSEAGQAIFRVIQAIGTVDLDHYSDGIIDVKTMTISQAIKAAYSSDTIIVHEGTYTEALYISKSLTIKGASTPVIKGGGTFTTNYMGAPWTREAVIFVVNSTNVVLENLDIEGEGLGPGYNDGVVYVYSSGEIRNGIISPNTIGDMYSLGVEARASDLKIIETKIENFGRIGAYFANCTGGVYYSTIIGQVYSDADKVNYGIEVEPHQGVRGTIEIIGNEICNSDNTYLPEPKWSSAGIVIDAWKEYMDTPSSTVIIQYNNIHHNYYGIEAAANALSYAHYNNIHNNREYGVISAPDYLGNNETFDARYNWWGHPTGPYHPEMNPSGKGDKISNNIDFEPWLIEPYPPPVPVETLLYIDPAKVEFWTPSYNQVFRVDLKIADVTNLTCYEFKLYWNTTLLDFDYAHIIEIWPLQIKWEDIDESLGRYWLGVTARGEEKFTGDATLVELYFKIRYDPIYPNNVYSLLNLNETILGDASEPIPQPIPHMVHDGEYWLYSTKPKMKVEPSMSTSKKLGKVFNVTITVQDIVNLYDFDFWLYYNTTLLDIYDPYVQLGSLMSGATVYIFEWNDVVGYVHFAAKLTSPAPPVNGSGTIAIVTFKVTAASVWPDPDLECALSLENTKLKTIGEIEVPHDEVDGLYRYTPVIGDLNSDGTVDLDDFYIISLAYGSEPGGPNWNRIADLNRDNIVNILDLRTAARHYGEDC